MYLTTNFQTLSEGIDNPNYYCIVEKNIICWLDTKIANAIWHTASQQMATNKNQLNYLMTCFIYFFPNLALVLVFKNCYNQHELVHSEKS